MVLRKAILFFILVFSGLILRAQDSYNYTPYGVGFFGSFNTPYDDLKKSNYGITVNATGYYNASPYTSLGLELQVGGLSGGSIVTDPNRRQYNNHYAALALHVDFALGEIIDYSRSDFLDAVKDFYLGTGFGVINNNMVFIQRTNLLPTGYPVGAYTFPGKNSSLNLMVPLRFGYEFKIYNEWAEPYLGIQIGYIHNYTFGEGLDGYADPPSKFRNDSPDQYRQFFIGVKYNFGNPTSYIKRIN